MGLILQCILLICLCLLVFYVFGSLTALLCKWEASALKVTLIGFFIYFCLFQLIALPMIMMQKSLTSLTNIWRIICIVVCLVTVVVGILKKSFPFPDVVQMAKTIRISKILAVICIIFLCYFVGVQRYLGWDTTYYIGVVNIAVDTDTMYVVDGYTGNVAPYLDLRYAMSTFYMHTAVLCKIFGLHPALMQRYTIGTLCVILSCIVVYLIGREVLKSEHGGAAFLMSWIFINFFFKTDFTTAQFLLYRAYEAKSFCANVIILSVLYLLIQLWKKEMRSREHWLQLFFIMFASVPISMSSLILIPALVGIPLTAWFIINRKLRVIPYGILCVLPNICYLLMYFLYTRNLFMISLK